MGGIDSLGQHFANDPNANVPLSTVINEQENSGGEEQVTRENSMPNGVSSSQNSAHMQHLHSTEVHDDPLTSPGAAVGADSTVAGSGGLGSRVDPTATNVPSMCGQHGGTPRLPRMRGAVGQDAPSTTNSRSAASSSRSGVASDPATPHASPEQ